MEHSFQSLPSLSQYPTFWLRVKQAASEGVLVGVKFGIIMMLLAVAWTLTVQDYFTTRRNASEAVTWINQQIAVQQRATQPAQK